MGLFVFKGEPYVSDDRGNVWTMLTGTLKNGLLRTPAYNKQLRAVELELNKINFLREINNFFASITAIGFIVLERSM